MVKLPVNEVHQAAKQAIEAVLKQYADQLSASELLAIMSQMTGMMVAVMDQTKYTPEQVMDLVMTNIVLGNEAMIQQSLLTPAGSA